MKKKNKLSKSSTLCTARAICRGGLKTTILVFAYKVKAGDTIRLKYRNITIEVTKYISALSAITIFYLQ